MKKYRFIQLVLLLSITVVSVSCKKENSNPIPTPPAVYYIKARLNGVPTEYTIDAKGTIENKHFAASAFSSTSSNFPMFSMEIEDVENIVVNNYSEENPATNLIFRYAKVASETFYSQYGDEKDFKINITEINGDYIKGIFSGTIRNSANNSESLTVSEGQFLVSR